MNKISTYALMLTLSLPALADIPSSDSLIMRFQAATLQQLGLKDGDSVTEWQDLADPNFVDGTLLPITGKNTPVLATDILNGKPVVRFNNSQVLGTNSFDWPDVSSGVTIVAVCTGDQSGLSGERLCGIGKADGTAGQYLAFDASISVAGADTGSGARFNNGKSLVAAQNPLDTGFHVAVLSIGQSDSYRDVRYYVDSSEPQTFDTLANPANKITLPATGNGFIVGSSWVNGSVATSDMFTGDLAEILVYNSELSEAEIEQAVDYLSGQYGLGDYTPVTDDMVIHLDASSISELADGDDVSEWTDIATADSINGTLFPVGSNALPTYHSETINGKSAVRFTNGQVLSTGDFSWLDVNDGLTICAVLTGDSSGQTGERAFGIGDKMGASGKVVVFDASTDTEGADGGSGYRFNNGKMLVKAANPLDTNYHIVFLQIDQSWQYRSGAYYVDQLSAQVFDNKASETNQLTLPATGNTLTLGTSWINGSLGTADYYSGDIAELMVFNRMLSGAEMQIILKDMYQKYFYNVITTSVRTLDLTEAQTKTFDVQLTEAPVSDVVLTLAETANPNQLAISPDTITCTAANWNIPVTVEVTAIDDEWIEGPHSSDIRIISRSSDFAFNDISMKVAVAVADNECVSANSSAADLDFNCVIDFEDLIILLKSWLWCDPMKDVSCGDVR